MAHSDVIDSSVYLKLNINSEETASVVSSPYITNYSYHRNRNQMIKKLLITSIFSLCLMGISCDRKTNNENSFQDKPDICFLDTLHDFGTIPMDSPVDSFDFRFVNKSGQAVVILAARTSCECTKAVFPKRPVLAGDSSYVRVIYDGTGRRPEFFNKSVTVTTSASFEDVILEISGELK